MLILSVVWSRSGNSNHIILKRSVPINNPVDRWMDIDERDGWMDTPSTRLRSMSSVWANLSTLQPACSLAKER